MEVLKYSTLTESDFFRSSSPIQWKDRLEVFDSGLKSFKVNKKAM